MAFKSVAAILVCTALAASAVASESYPARPIRMLTAEAGGAADIVARIMGQALTRRLGQQVIVDNRGGSAIIPAQIAAKAPADGHTLIFYGSTLWILPLMQNVPYDPVKDFSPITLVDRSPNVLVVYPGLPANSVKELIALAKARPGQLNYASGSLGATAHLAAELFKVSAGVDIARVTYKGTAPALNDLIAGQVHLMFPNAPGVMPHVKAGRLRALAIASAQASVLVPGVPTIAASGLPGYEAESSYGLWAPAGTPGNLIERLNRETVAALNTPEVNTRLLSAGVEKIGNTAAEFAAKIRSEMAIWGKVIEVAGIRLD